MAQPLRLLIDVVNKVERGEFEPDLTRSGLFAKEAGGADNDVDDIVSSSCGSDDEDDRDIHAEENAIEQVAGTWQPAAQSGDESAVFVRHCTSRCIHKLMDESGLHLACGRAMSARYEVQADRPKFMHPLCGTCFKDY